MGSSPGHRDKGQHRIPERRSMSKVIEVRDSARGKKTSGGREEKLPPERRQSAAT